MADESPEKPKATKPAVSGGLGEGLRLGLNKNATDALAQMAAQWQPRYSEAVRDALAAAGQAKTEQEEDLQPAVVGGEEKKPKPRSRPKRTSLDRIPGRRPMKEYPVTGEELLTLGIMQGGAALMLAFAGTCFGFYLSTRQTIDFAGTEVSQATVGWWSGMGDAAYWLAVVTVGLGLALGALSGFKVRRIMKNTDHG